MNKGLHSLHAWTLSISSLDVRHPSYFTCPKREVREKEREDFNCENEVKTNGPPPNRKTTRLPALRMPVSGIYLLLESACQWVLDALPLCHGNCGVPIFEPSLQRHLDLTRVIWWY